MRGDGVPTVQGTLDSEAVAEGVLKGQGAIPGLFEETGLQDPQGVIHMKNQWRQHGYHAFLGVLGGNLYLRENQAPVLLSRKVTPFVCLFRGV